MQNRDFIKLAKEEYKKIGYVECPAFSGERVYFTNKGFLHLLRKGRELRPIDIQIQRIKLIGRGVEIIRKSSKVNTYRKTEKQIKIKNTLKNSIAHFWSFKDNNIIVVICQINNEPKHFLSIMTKD